MNAGCLPGLDSLADPRCGTEQRDIRKPAIGEEARHIVASVLSYCALYCGHLLDVAGLLPVVPVIRQERIVDQVLSADCPRRLDVVADAGRQHVADKERGVIALR